MKKDARICILVHGYNNSFHEVCDSYQLIERQLKTHMNQSYDHVVGYAWPGEDNALEWYQAKSNANGTGRKLRMLLDQLVQEVTVDIISHSLGARVVLKALKDKDPGQPKIRNYYCMAGAVDNESLETSQEFNAALQTTGRIFVMHSARDSVLAGSYRVTELDNPIGLYGPEDKGFVDQPDSNIYVANCKQVVANHGGYKRSPEVFQYINQSLTPNTMARFTTL